MFGDEVHQVNGARQAGGAAAHEEDVYGHALALDLRHGGSLGAEVFWKNRLNTNRSRSAGLTE